MTSDRPRPSAWRTSVVSLVALLASGTAGCAASPVGSGAVAPVELDLPVPSYALGTREGLVVRSGGPEVRLPEARSGAFLPNGDVLVDLATQQVQGHFRVLHPASGELSGDVRTVGNDEPGRSVTRIDVLEPLGEPARLRPHDLDLRPLPALDLPATDDPAATDSKGLERGYYGVAATSGDTTLVLWHDGSEFYDDGDYGVARVRHPAGAEPRVDDILLNQRLVALYLSADGSAVLGVQQDKGKPCGGCVTSQSIVEIDPGSGELTDRGHPDAYDKRWRVDAIDRVGDRIAVRYESTDGTGGRRSRRLVGTYVYEDGRWSLMGGSDEKTTWWQDGGRVIARPEDERADLDGYTLSWLEDGDTGETVIAGELALTVGSRYVEGSVPGQLLPPE